MKKFLLSVFLLLASASAWAQFSPGQLVTAAALNGQFALYVPIAGGTLTGPLTVPTLNTANAISSGSTNGELNAASCGSNPHASWCSGSDLGAWVNAAWASCSNKCTVYVPAGTYNSVTTTIEYPVSTNGTAALRIDPGATINYTGTGYAIEASGAGQASVNLNISGGGQIVGTSSGVAGIHLEAFNKGQIYGLSIHGFTNGDAVFNQGVNTVDYFATNFSGNKNGVHNVGVVVSGQNYSANAIKMHGGQISANTNWGWFEDGSQSGTVGPNQNNVAQGVVFENNGTDGNAQTGQVFVQSCDACAFDKNYFEYFAGSSKTNSILLGDATYVANTTSIRDNLFGSVGATSTVSAVNSSGLELAGNGEEGAPTNFFLLGTASRHTFIGKNDAFAATNYLAGVDNGDTVVVGNGGAVTWVNASGSSQTGYGFNQLSGLNQDLVIRDRVGGTNTVQFKNSVGTATSSIDDSGNFNGSVVARINGVENFANNAQGFTFFSNDTVIRAPAAGAILLQDTAGGFTAPMSSGPLTVNGALSATTTGAMPLYGTTGTGVNAPHMVQGSVALSSGSATVTLSGSAVYTSSSSYTCTANDTTAAAAVKVGQTSGTSVTFTGTSTDTVQFICAGS